MLQTKATVMGTELSRLHATAHFNTQVGITSWPGSIKSVTAGNFPGGVDSTDIFCNCQKLPTVDKKYEEMSCQLPTSFPTVGIFFLKK